MAFRFNIAQPVGVNAEEMLTRQLSKAIRLMRAGVADVEQVEPGIHGARKCFKRSRSLLKLIRPGLKRSAARRLNAALRDCARGLGGERDRTVGLQTLLWLAAQPEGLPEPLVAAVRKLYLAPAEPQAGTEVTDPTLVRALLDDASDRAEAILTKHLPALNLDRIENVHVARAYATGYGDGRSRYFALDILTADDEDVHDLRKPVQGHWRQTALLYELWPEQFHLRLETARRISKALGLDHDLSLLAERVDEGLHVRRLRDEKQLLLQRCRDMQRQLRREVEPSLRRLYGPPPSAWEETLLNWWRAACDEMAQTDTECSQSLAMRAIS